MNSNPEALDPAMQPAQPAAEIPPLGADEIQQLREILARSAENRNEEFRLPDKPPSAEDKTKYYESALARKPYAEEHTMIGGKLKVRFREKTKRETDILFDVIQKDFADRRIRSQHDFVTLMNNYNLAVQMTHFQGVEQPPVIPPPGVPVPPDFADVMRKQLDNHMLAAVPEMTMMILIGALNQFQNRVKLMAQEVLRENFPTPVGAS